MAEPESEDTHLLRFRKMPVPVRVVYARPRTFVAIGDRRRGLPAAAGSLRLVTRLLIGWDVFVALYLVLAFAMMLRKRASPISAATRSCRTTAAS